MTISMRQASRYTTHKIQVKWSMASRNSIKNIPYLTILVIAFNYEVVSIDFCVSYFPYTNEGLRKRQKKKSLHDLLCVLNPSLLLLNTNCVIATVYRSSSAHLYFNVYKNLCPLIIDFQNSPI